MNNTTFSNDIYSKNSSSEQCQQKKVNVLRRESHDFLLELKKMLHCSQADFKANEAWNVVREYVKKRSPRIMYSDLTPLIQFENDSDEDRFTHNLDALYEIAINNSCTSNGRDVLEDPACLLIHKIRDHVMLTRSQNLAIERVLQETKAKEEEIDRQIKGVMSLYKDMQKHGITMLGIFASIVVAFVGCFIFSTSTFSYIYQTEFFKLTFFFVLVVWVSCHMIYLLLTFLVDLNGLHDGTVMKNRYKSYMEKINWILGICLAISLLGLAVKAYSG